MGSRSFAALLLLVIAIASSLHLASAGGYRNNKHLKKVIPMEDRFMNFEPVLVELEKEKLPSNWDWCDVDGTSYCAPSWNQHLPVYCGSCWAHGTLSALNDRVKIMKKGRGMDVMLGRQTLLNCAALKGYGNGCDGGDPIDVFRYMHEYGLPHEDCMPYSATDHTKYDGQDLTQCPVEGQCLNCMPNEEGMDECWPVKTPIIYGLKSYGQCCNRTTSGEVEVAMMNEIFARGPITCSVAVSEKMIYGYRSGVWMADGYDEVDHDVEVVGWGTDENGVDFWKIRNSWGTYWGELGFYKLQRGVNADFIESGDCWVGVPDISMEKDVMKGKLVGSMFGLVDPEDDTHQASGKVAVEKVVKADSEVASS